MTNKAAGAMQRGAALIMALLVVALATIVATQMLVRQNAWLRQVETQRDLAQAQLIAVAGIDWARAVLAHDGRTSAYDHLGESWAMRVPSMPAEEGEIGGGLSDEQGKWNLNNLVRNGRLSTEDLTVFRHLLTRLDLPDNLAPALVDWLDADGKMTPGGAEASAYLARHPPYRVANRELSDVDGLLRVQGFERDHVERLRPYVSALPGYNPVNVNTADAMVLSAVLYDFPETEIQKIVSDRVRIPFIDMSDFRKRVSSSDLAAAPSTERLDTRSRFFSVSIQARMQRTHFSLIALLDRQAGWPSVVWQKFE